MLALSLTLSLTLILEKELKRANDRAASCSAALTESRAEMDAALARLRPLKLETEQAVREQGILHERCKAYADEVSQRLRVRIRVG